MQNGITLLEILIVNEATKKIIAMLDILKAQAEQGLIEGIEVKSRLVDGGVATSSEGIGLLGASNDAGHDEEVVENLSPACKRLVRARQRVGSHLMLSRKLSAIGYSLSPKQLRSLEQGGKILMSWSEVAVIVRALGAHGDYMFPTAIESDQLVSLGARVLAEILNTRGPEDYVHAHEQAFMQLSRPKNDFVFDGYVQYC